MRNIVFHNFWIYPKSMKRAIFSFTLMPFAKFEKSDRYLTQKLSMTSKNAVNSDRIFRTLQKAREWRANSSVELSRPQATSVDLMRHQSTSGDFMRPQSNSVDIRRPQLTSGGISPPRRSTDEIAAEALSPPIRSTDEITDHC